MRIFTRQTVAIISIDILCAERLYYSLRGAREAETADLEHLAEAIRKGGGFKTELDEIAELVHDAGHAV